MKKLFNVILCGLFLFTAAGCAVFQGQPDYVYTPAHYGQERNAVSENAQTSVSRPESTGELQQTAGLGRSLNPQLQEEINDTVPVETAAGTRATRLSPNDSLMVHLSGIPRQERPEFSLVVDEHGFITLPYIEPIRAAGLTASELQSEIRSAYVDGEIYRNITVNITIPTQNYFVRGEVRQPGRYPKISGLTVLQAIASAGGYTEFANSRRITMIREGETTELNARDIERNPERDIEIEPGDIIIVPRSMF